MRDDEVVHQDAIKGRHSRVAPNMVYGSRKSIVGAASSHPHCIIPHCVARYLFRFPFLGKF